MNKTTKVLLGIALSLLIFIFFLPRFFSSMAREFLHKQFPQVEVTIGDLTLGWFSVDAGDVTLKTRGDIKSSSRIKSIYPFKIKKIHITFNPWDLPNKKVKEIVIDSTGATMVTVWSLIDTLEVNPYSAPAPAVSRVAVTPEKKAASVFSFKTIKIQNMRLVGPFYEILINIIAHPMNGGIKGNIEADITSSYGVIRGISSFSINIAKEEFAADISLKSKSFQYENFKIEHPEITLKVKNENNKNNKSNYDNYFSGFLKMDAATINYEHDFQGTKIPLSIPKLHLEGPVQINGGTTKFSFQLTGEVGSIPLDLKGNYGTANKSGHINLKPIKVPLKAPWLQAILPQMAPVPGLDLQHLDGALTLHSSVDIIKGVVTPHYTIKADTGKVVTAVLENAVRGTLENTVMLPGKTVEAVGGLLGKLFS